MAIPYDGVTPMFTDDQLRKALLGEYVYLCHDDFDPDNDMTEEQYKEWLSTLSRDELISTIAIDFDDNYTLTDFVQTYSN